MQQMPYIAVQTDGAASKMLTRAPVTARRATERSPLLMHLRSLLRAAPQLRLPQEVPHRSNTPESAITPATAGTTPFATPSPQSTGSTSNTIYGGMSLSDRIAIGVGIGIGLPATIVGILTLCVTYRGYVRSHRVL
jgi:hypothetical protein